MTQHSTEGILLPLQKMQQAHDEAAHKDILSFDLYKRLKHMVLHFFKYAGRIESVRSAGDLGELRRTLIDTYIICMASANALNLSLGEAIKEPSPSNDLDSLARALSKNLKNGDQFEEAIRHLVLLGGQMAKAIESADHMEDGNPRSALMDLVPKLAEAVLGMLGRLNGNLESDVRSRLQGVEKKSIFLRPLPALGK